MDEDEAILDILEAAVNDASGADDEEQLKAAVVSADEDEKKKTLDYDIIVRSKNPSHNNNSVIGQTATKNDDDQLYTRNSMSEKQRKAVVTSVNEEEKKQLLDYDVIVRSKNPSYKNNSVIGQQTSTNDDEFHTRRSNWNNNDVLSVDNYLQETTSSTISLSAAVGNLKKDDGKLEQEEVNDDTNDDDEDDVVRACDLVMEKIDIMNRQSFSPLHPSIPSNVVARSSTRSSNASNVTSSSTSIDSSGVFGRGNTTLLTGSGRGKTPRATIESEYDGVIGAVAVNRRRSDIDSEDFGTSTTFMEQDSTTFYQIQDNNNTSRNNEVYNRTRSSRTAESSYTDIDKMEDVTETVTAYLVDDEEDYIVEKRMKDIKEQREIELQQAAKEKEDIERRLRQWKCTVRFALVTAALVVLVVVLVLVERPNDGDNNLEPTQTSSSLVSSNGFRAFNSTTELWEAVDLYIVQKNPEGSLVAKTYGYPIGIWDVSRISNFSRVFDPMRWDRFDEFRWTQFDTTNQTSDFNEDIGNWNVSQATTMFGMFAAAVEFNQDISRWDVSKVTDFSQMFAQAVSFNQNLSTWNVGNAQNMSSMFYNTTFNGDISKWNTRNVNTMDSMFMWNLVLPNTTRFTSWDTSAVTTTRRMFRHCHHFDSTDLETWDVSNVVDMSEMFSFAFSFNSGDITKWDVSNVENMAGMFANTTVFNQDISQWDVSKVKRMDLMFYNASMFHQDLCSWNSVIESTLPNRTGVFDYSNCTYVTCFCIR